MQRALLRVSSTTPPSPELKKVHYDFGTNGMTEQVEFMTRNFLIESEIGRQAWKLNNRMVRVLGYICMGAAIQTGDDIITAWFTSEIPVSAGPDRFYGLPGLILAVEINGETAFKATSVDPTPPEDSAMLKPDTGKAITQEEFNKTVAEKIKEWEETGGGRRGIRR